MRKKILYVLKNYGFLNSLYEANQKEFKIKNEYYIKTVEIINNAFEVLKTINSLYYFILHHYYREEQSNEVVFELIHEEFKEYSGYSFAWYSVNKKKAIDKIVEILLASDDIKIIEKCADDLLEKKA